MEENQGIRRLYVKNKVEELIGEIILNGRIEFRGDRLVVGDYSRDELILHSKTQLTIRGVEPKEKFIGFGKYLEERKKAGVIQLPNGEILYILPPDQKGQYDELRCYFKQRNPSTSQSHKPTTSLPSSSPVPTDFLSNLLVKVLVTRYFA
jgi:hypothetical protein